MAKKFIVDFMDAVYDGNGALSLASFNEEKALKDATEKIAALRARVEALEKAGSEFLAHVDAEHFIKFRAVLGEKVQDSTQAEIVRAEIISDCIRFGVK
jgi:hypothetical protein